METPLVQIREQQKEIWNRFSPGWKKWDDLTMDFLKPMADEIIHLIRPKDTDMVLDVASGTGEPGLTIAAMLRGGTVVATDLAVGMLEVARENAVRRGIKNFEIVACDVCELPFPDNSFDAISCRLGFMFFPDMLLAANEMVRVLKPGGRIAVTVWDGPERNLWASSLMGIISKNMHLTPPPPGSPGLFRCAKSGLVADLFDKAGLRNISETEVRGKLNIGNRKVYWNYMTEVVAPVVSALSKADCEMKIKIRSEVFKSISQQYTQRELTIDSNAFVIYGEK
jgi:ubiquinone/menaquinone biosynthesis C-methylase UbiE